MHTFFQDVRYAIRMLIKNPGLTLIALITLAVGIGVNTTIFSAVDALVFRPLPFHDLDRIMTLWTVQDGQSAEEREGASPADYLDWRDRNTVFEQLAAFQGADVNITGAGDPEYVIGAQTTSNFFEALGVKAAYGRLFLPGEDDPGHNRVAVISHTLWQRRFAGDPDFVGRTLTLNGENVTVIGILLPDHHYPLETDLWTPLALTAELRRERTKKSLSVIGRLKDSVSEAQAQAAMTTVMSRIAEQYPETHRGLNVSVISLRDQNGDEITSAFSYTLLGAVAFVLLIACANVMNLQFARATGRQKEIAIRAALGANRWRVVRQLLTESTLLAILAGFLGLMLALWSIDVLKAALPQTITRFVPMWNYMGLDDRMLTFTMIIVGLTGLLSGLAPALQASRPNLNETLTDSSRGSSGGVGRRRLRSGLVVSEVALALILLVGAGFMIQGFMGLVNKDPGFDPENALTLRVTLPETKYSEPHLTTTFYREAYERLAAIPGVEGVGGANFLHADNRWDTVPVEVEGRPALSDRDLPRINRHIVSTEYLSTLHIPLMQGRPFTDSDDEQASPVVIISQSMAQQYWPGQDPVGKRIKIGITPSVEARVMAESPWRTVVGVVGDASYFWFDVQPRATVYLPAQQAPRRWMNVVVRTSGDPLSIAPEARTRIAGLDPEQAVADVRTMEEVINNRLVGVRLGVILMGIFGIIALIMAAVGIYSVMSYSVAQRTQEIGIRMAIGARQRDVLMMVARQGLKLAAVGLVIGLPASYALSSLMSSGLGAVMAFNLSTFVVITVGLVGVAAVATLIPAHRATRVDPMVALRYE